MSKFNLGDKVYFIHQGQTEKYTTCPDCCGQKYLTVIMGDDSRVTIPCTGCACGYGDPTGAVRYYEFTADIKLLVVTAVKIGEEEFEYELLVPGGGHYCPKESQVFATREEAEERGKALVAEHNQQELDKIKKKHNMRRDWAWNATYYRKEVKRAKEDLERYTKRLDWANQVKKEKV